MDGDGRDLGDDPDARAYEPAEVRDLTRHVEAELDHRDLVCGFEAQERQRHADLVVERRGGAQDAVTRSKRRGGRLLRRRLPDIARDTYGGDRIGVTQDVGQTAQRVERLRHLDEDRVIRCVDRVLDDSGACAVRERVRDECVSVTLVAKREEHFARLHDPRIERPADEFLVSPRRAVYHAPTARGE